MIELLKDWIIGMTCAAMIAAMLGAFLPKSGGVGRAGRLAAGLLLMLAAVRPLMGLDYESLSGTLARLRVSQSDRGAELAAQNKQILKELIESETEAYISDKAKELGINCRAEVLYAFDADGAPYPSRIRIAGELTQEQQRELSRALEAELGVPLREQSYTKEAG